jgi:GxxExxY protein
MDMQEGQLTERILACAFRVHSQLGPGLLEGAYKACLVQELKHAQLDVAVEVPIPIVYRGVTVDCAYRADLVVEDKVLVELKSVETLRPVHAAQVITYLKLSDIPIGLLLNFNARHLRDGVRRFNLRSPAPLVDAPIDQ